MSVSHWVFPNKAAKSLRFDYELYGLCISSEWRIPGLNEVPASSAQVSLHTGDTSVFAEGRKALVPGPLNWFNRAVLPDQSEYLLWPTLFEFLVGPDARVVIGNMLEQGTPEALEVYLLGQVLSFVLIKRGIEPVHGTAIVVDGKAVGFVGDCSFGKSTLAAAFLRAGFPLLTDDLLVTSVDEHAVSAHPGPPRIKLLPASASALLGEGVSGARMNAYTNKFIVPLSGNLSCRKTVPLAAIYMLSDPSTDQQSGGIGKLSPHEACIALLRNTFNTTVVEPQRSKQLLHRYSELATRIPIRTLTYPREFSVLPDVVRSVVGDVRANLDY